MFERISNDDLAKVCEQEGFPSVGDELAAGKTQEQATAYMVGAPLLADDMNRSDHAHGRVRSRWSGCLGQVAAHRDDGIEIIMDDGETLTLSDQADIDDFEWLGDVNV